MSVLAPAPADRTRDEGGAGTDDEADGHGEFEWTVVSEHAASVELVVRLLRAYRHAPAAADIPTIDRLLEVLTPLVCQSFIDAVALRP